MVGCANKYWTEDLLLLSRDFLTDLGEVSHINSQYEILVVPDDHDENTDILIPDTRNV